MNDNLLLYILYGLVAGFSEYTPLSASAHQALFPMLLRFNSTWPLLRFFVHLGALGALIFLNWSKITHIYREISVAAISPRQRNRIPDRDAILDARIISVAGVPALIGAIGSAFTGKGDASLLLMAIMLIVGAIASYIPDYLPGGDRKAGSMCTLDGIVLGICAGCSVIPGLSATGLMLSAGLIRKCDKNYILNIVFLVCGVMLAGQATMDLVMFIISGFSGMSMIRIVGCFLAAMASFGGATGAIFTMRYLIVKDGLSGFAFYGWGLGLFSLILYLMV
jgi:undecaprenyl-diphosphatase